MIQLLHDCILVENILVIGDLHIGYDEYSHGKVVFPGSQLKEIINKLEEIFQFLNKNNKKVKKIILLGDVKHDFGAITDIEWRETLQFFDYLKNKIGEKGKIIIIKGNHDNILKPIVKKRNILLRDYYCIEIKGRKMCFMHGNKLFKQCLNVQTNKRTTKQLKLNEQMNRQTASTNKQIDKQRYQQIIFLGHLHPAITLSDKYKSEKYKCFLHGNLKGKEVYVLPSFSSLSFGYELLDLETGKEKFFIIPPRDLRKFDVVIYNNKEKKEYNFGRLNKLI